MTQEILRPTQILKWSTCKDLNQSEVFVSQTYVPRGDVLSANPQLNGRKCRTSKVKSSAGPLLLELPPEEYFLLNFHILVSLDRSGQTQIQTV